MSRHHTSDIEKLLSRLDEQAFVKAATFKTILTAIMRGLPVPGANLRGREHPDGLILDALAAVESARPPFSLELVFSDSAYHYVKIYPGLVLSHQMALPQIPTWEDTPITELDYIPVESTSDRWVCIQLLYDLATVEVGAGNWVQSATVTDMTIVDIALTTIPGDFAGGFNVPIGIVKEDGTCIDLARSNLVISVDDDGTASGQQLSHVFFGMVDDYID